MELRKLGYENLDEIRKKKIICYVKVKDYIQEINNKYHLLENIFAIVDEHKRNWGECICDDITIPVLSEEYLDTVDWDNAVLLITSEYYNEVYEKICQNERLKNVLDVVYYFADRETEYYEEYLNYYKSYPLEDIIVFRSGPRNNVCKTGMDFSDNSKAIFEYLLQNKYNSKYRLVWMVKNPEVYSKYLQYDNVSFLSFDGAVSENKEERDLYYRQVCLAKYFFFTDALDLARNSREGQIRIQLWHGEGFKTRAIFSRFEKRCEYTSVSSEVYQKIHEEIFGFRKNQILIAGVAKQDWILHRVPSQVLYDLGVPKAEKYIFWLPTFRATQKGLEALNEVGFKSNTGLPLLNTVELLQQVNAVLKAMEVVLIIKLHPMQKKVEYNQVDFSNIVFLENDQLTRADVHINQLLGYADALISDYSSVAVDYLLLDRPLAFVLDDIQEYKESRGFVFDNIQEWLPGKEIYSIENFLEFIKEVKDEVDSGAEKRKRISKKMLNWTDDKNCKRIVEAIGIQRQ